jgi:cell division protein FtsB
MFINMRYLVITLIAVFLALGIGILIGFQLDSQDIILQQQDDLIKSLENKFDQLTQTNQSLENQIKQLQSNIERDQAFMKNIFADYVQNKLSGLTVTIIETSESSLYPQLKYALETAGATINASIVVTDKILSTAEEQQSPELELPIAAIIADAIAYGQTKSINTLQQQGFIEIKGNFDTTCDFVIIVGGSNEETKKPEIVDVPLIQELKKMSINVVGVESSDAGYSYMDYYKKEQISTVDNVDTIIGQTSLVLIMTGQQGNYGIKASAGALIPSFGKEEPR